MSVCHAGGSHPSCWSMAAAFVAAWMCAGACSGWASCCRMDWVTDAAWRCKTGRASAHDAQKAGVAVKLAGVRPSPPCDKGRCAVAMAVAGRFAVCRSWDKHVVMARSWLSAKVAVASGGRRRSR